LNPNSYVNEFYLQDIRAVYALVNKALQHSDELDMMYKILTDKAEGTAYVDEFKSKILLTELFWGKQMLPNVPDNNNVKVIHENMDRLSAVPASKDEFISKSCKLAKSFFIII